jgi:broad specificity phosphatase PhoE
MSQYDQADVSPAEIDCSDVQPDSVYSSNLKRAVITAESKYKGLFVVSELIREVPLTAAFSTSFKLPPLLRLFIGRIFWFFNSKRQEEKRKESNIRAMTFLEECCRLRNNEDKTIILFTHGFFMGVLKRILKREGFKTKGFFIARHAEPYLFEK